MINSREEVVDKIKKAKHFKGKSLALRFAKSGMFDNLIGKTDEELADMLLRIIRNGGKDE